MAEEAKQIQIELVKAPVFEIDPNKKYLIILPNELFENAAKELGAAIKRVMGSTSAILIAAEDPSKIKVVEYDSSKDESSESGVSTPETKSTTKNN